MRKEDSHDLDYAVVAGIDLNGLGVIRALAGAGVPVIALDTDLTKPTAATRFGLKIAVRALSGDAFIEDLMKLRKNLIRNPVLILTQEASVGTVSAQRARIDSAYRFTLPPDAVVQDLLDKFRFQAIAEHHGYLVPRALRLSRDTEFSRLGQLRYPCVLKPATKDPEYGRWFAKAYKVASHDDALRLWQKMRDKAERVIIQEWIDGDDADVYFCLQYRPRSRPAISFVGRKLCQWPPLVGGTASCMPAPEFELELADLTNQFFAAVGFVGMCSLEYKRDRRDGRFYMVEPTVGRTDLQEEIAPLNGINIPFAAYRSELGLDVVSTNRRNPPRIWRDTGGLTLARRAGAVVPQVSRSAKTYDALFRMGDPAPLVALKVQSVRNKLSRMARIMGLQHRATRKEPMC